MKELIETCSCSVPKHLHGTACGWVNASCIVNPQNDQEREWKTMWEINSQNRIVYTVGNIGQTVPLPENGYFFQGEPIPAFVVSANDIPRKKITVAQVRLLLKQVNSGEISFSRMVEILNETVE